LVAEGELDELDGNYLSEDVPRAIIHRSEATEEGFATRRKGHQKASLLTSSTEKQRRFSLLYPDETKAAGIDGRMGTFQDLKQRVGLGIERSKRDEIVALFNWNEDEENELADSMAHLKPASTINTSNKLELTILYLLFCL